MDYLFDGVREFNTTDYIEYKELFQRIGREQQPHSLFIGCSDSRVVPNLITKTLPGELFVIRNIANIVPFYRETDEFVATTSAIEYAVKVLQVENIIICGHSNCGGCNALLLEDDKLEHMPHTRKWLELARNVREKIRQSSFDDPYEKEWRAEQLNIVEQMNHLLSYPYIKEKYQQKKINIIGWYYIIQTGEVFNYNKETSTFEKIK